MIFKYLLKKYKNKIIKKNISILEKIYLIVKIIKIIKILKF